jgi:1-acyl-sn-glycerol-3-phosphate acyltransferase
MLRPFYLLAFRLLGWRIVGTFPPHLKKYVVAVGPHTSNWDFIIGLAARSILRMQHAKFLGKSALFRAPYGWFFRWLGGTPVDRSQSHDMVEQVAARIRASDRFILAISPEGTRKKVSKLRTGFYYIAKAAGIPIIPVGFDFAKKQIIISAPLMPANFERDMDALLAFYRGVNGKRPELGIA